MKSLGFLWRSDDAATTTEYAVVIGLIILICLAAITSIGNKVSNVSTNLDESLPTG